MNQTIKYLLTAPEVAFIAFFLNAVVLILMHVSEIKWTSSILKKIIITGLVSISAIICFSHVFDCFYQNMSPDDSWNSEYFFVLFLYTISFSLAIRFFYQNRNDFFKSNAAAKKEYGHAVANDELSSGNHSSPVVERYEEEAFSTNH